MTLSNDSNGEDSSFVLFIFVKISFSKPNFFINYHLCLIVVDYENQEPHIKGASQIEKPNDILYKISEDERSCPAYDLLFRKPHANLLPKLNTFYFTFA